jgi:hypothetical protein
VKTKDKKQKVDMKKIQEALEFGRKLIAKEGVGAEGYLITFHVVKDDGDGKKKIIHHFNYENFPTGDWGKVVVATGVEARRAELIAQTGATKG